jgi:hypothetical protein
VPDIAPYYCPKCGGTDVVGLLPIRGEWSFLVVGIGTEDGALLVEGLQHQSEPSSRTITLLCDGCKHEWTSRREWHSA